MKILFIASKESDYLQDLTYHGLCKFLGNKNVIDFPLNLNYHLPFEKYPRNLGCSPSFPSLMIPWKKIDIVIVGSAKPETFKYYLSVVNKIPKSTKVIFLDGGDFSSLGGDLTRLKAPELYTHALSKRPFDFIFKREYLLQDQHPQNVLPLPFGINFDQMPVPKQASYKYDVSFWAVESDPIRSQALQLLENKFDCQSNGTHRNQVFKKYKRKGRFYLEELQNCRVTLNFRGVGWDTLRYWEVPAVGGFLISQKPQIRIPDEFVNGKDIVYCNNDLSDLLSLCEYYLKEDLKREEIAKAAYQKARQFHSTEARAKYILKVLE